MSGGIPLSPGFPDQTRESRDTPGALQVSIADKIETLLGYEITNPYLIKFINEFGHPNQLKCEPTDSMKRLHNARLCTWEKIFTDSFYRAAVIVARKTQESSPGVLGINMEHIMTEAGELIQRENEGRLSVRQDTGYPD